MRYVTAVLLLLMLLLAAPVGAQVHVDIGIHLPAPPQLVVVPQQPAIRYVPSSHANLFAYNGQYWAFVNDGWYVSQGYQGPWLVVGPQFVPRPLLLVPVRYYHVPPGHWRAWQREAPPRWGREWGPEWASKRGWKDRDDDRDRGRGKGRGDDRKFAKKELKNRDHDRDRGHGRGRDDDRRDDDRGRGRGKGH